ncbi:lipoprotein [Enterobacteriaceae bacterium ESL0689]|nr:lipoprotein [Enterobacteriaceae bacterium ESL0689]
MKNIFPVIAICLAVSSLIGCGLKGPLYFPPADKTSSSSVVTQSLNPDRHDQGDNEEISHSGE